MNILFCYVRAKCNLSIGLSPPSKTHQARRQRSNGNIDNNDDDETSGYHEALSKATHHIEGKKKQYVNCGLSELSVIRAPGYSNKKKKNNKRTQEPQQTTTRKREENKTTKTQENKTKQHKNNNKRPQNTNKQNKNGNHTPYAISENQSKKTQKS